MATSTSDEHRCYCGGPEEQLYGHVYGQGDHCSRRQLPPRNDSKMTFGEPAPRLNDFPSMHDLVIRDMGARKKFGLEKYGTILQPFNGRNALKDAYEEILDLAVYLRQKLFELEMENASDAGSNSGEAPSTTQASSGKV